MSVNRPGLKMALKATSRNFKKGEWFHAMALEELFGKQQNSKTLRVKKGLCGGLGVGGYHKPLSASHDESLRCHFSSVQSHSGWAVHPRRSSESLSRDVIRVIATFARFLSLMSLWPGPPDSLPP